MKHQKQERRQSWLLFGLLQPLLLVLFALLGEGDFNSPFSCAALILAVTLGFSIPFLLISEMYYQLGYGWD
jgi:hypothetical protein